MAGFTLVDFKRNTEIWNHLIICDLNEEIGNQKRSWYEHILRMDENRLANILLNHRTEGDRQGEIQDMMERLIQLKTE